MENGAIELPADATRAKFHEVFGTSDEDLVREGVLENVGMPGHGAIYVAASVPSPAADVGERAAVAQLVDGLPDDAVQHLRRFLEAVSRK